MTQLELVPSDESPKTEVLPEIVGPEFEQGWVEGLSDEAYHADKTALSSSAVRYAYDSALMFHECFVLGVSNPPTDSMRLGTAAHLAILEPEEFRKRYIQMPDFGAMQSSKNRAARDEWVESQPRNACILTEKELKKLNKMINSLLRHTVACNMLKDGVREAVGYFRDPETGLKGRIKPDFLRHDLTVLPDLKTCHDPSYKGFLSAVKEHRYDMQLAWYSRGVKAIHNRAPENLCWIAVQNKEPYDVCVWAMPPSMLELAERHLNKGTERIVRGIQTGNWPGIQEDGMAQVIDFPPYFYEKELYE